jgi:hypothetical protein
VKEQKMPVSLFKKFLFLLAISVAVMDTAHAFGFGNMMNPSRWFGGGNRDRYDNDYYGAPPYGYGYPGGYAAPGYAAPGYTTPGYPAPGYGYGAPAYPAPAAATAPAAKATEPETKTPAVISADEAEIARLKQRISELEAQGVDPTPFLVPEATQGAVSGSGTPDYPVYSPYGHQPSGAAATPAEPAQGGGSEVTGAQPEYPVYSPYGKTSAFPSAQPAASAAAAQHETPAVPPVTTPAVPAAAADKKAAEPPAAAAQGQNEQAGSQAAVTVSPYGNPANYVPPMQDIGGQRVYDFGH